MLFDLTHFDDLTCILICGGAPILKDIKFGWVCHFAPCANLHGLLVLSHKTKRCSLVPNQFGLCHLLGHKWDFYH